MRLLFQDEARFGKISDVRRCWCPRPHRPMLKAMVGQEYTYAYAAISPGDGHMDSLILPHVNGQCMQLFISAWCWSSMEQDGTVAGPSDCRITCAYCSCHPIPPN